MRYKCFDYFPFDTIVVHDATWYKYMVPTMYCTCTVPGTCMHAIHFERKMSLKMARLAGANDVEKNESAQTGLF